jgi:hypothetical protein
MPAVAKTLLLPHENPPIRLPTFPNLERTAVVSFETNLTTNSNSFGKSTLLSTIVREPAAPLWLEQKVEDNDAGRAAFAYAYEAVAAGVTQTDPNLIAIGSGAPLGTDGTFDTWIYIPYDQQDGLNVFIRAGAGGTGTMDCEFVDSTGRRETVYGATVGVGTTFTFGRSVWLRVTSIKATTGPLILYFFPQGSARILEPAFAPPEISVSRAPYDSTRVTAQSTLFTNVSRVQVKQGTIRASRIQSPSYAWWGVPQSALSLTHPAERYFGSAEMGCYVVSPPTQEAETFRKTFRSIPGTITGASTSLLTTDLLNTTYAPLVSFDSDDPFMAVVIEEEGGVDETQMAVTVDSHIEFRTTSPLFQVGISTLPLEMYHASQMVVAQAGFIFENATHWKELATRVAQLVTRVIPVLYPGSRLALVAKTAALLLPQRAPVRSMTQKQMVIPRARRVARRNRRKTDPPRRTKRN